MGEGILFPLQIDKLGRVVLTSCVAASKDLGVNMDVSNKGFLGL